MSMPITIGRERLYDTTEAARYLGLEASLVRRYCIEKRLPARKLGGKWVITKKELDRFAKEPRLVGNPNFRSS